MWINHRYISKEWLVSPRARSLYRASAGLSLILIAIRFSLHHPGILPQSGPSFLLFEACVVVAVLASAMTLVAMEFYLILFDESSTLPRLLWFFVLLLVPIGPALYCFLVYSRSQHFRSVEVETSAGALS